MKDAARRRRLCLLVVDDSVAIRCFLRTVLEASGHDVVTADGVMSALQSLGDLRLDAILTDFNMPTATGHDLVMAVRTQKRFDTTPIVVVSSVDAPDIQDRMAGAGANGWVCKPIRVPVLLATIDDVLQFAPPVPRQAFGCGVPTDVATKV